MTITVLGFGAAGRAVTEALVAKGSPLVVAQRSRPPGLPQAAQFTSCDVLDAASVQAAIAGSEQVVMAVGFAYDSRLWRTAWPKAMHNVVEGCAATGARLVFVDNLYQLGPQREPRTEKMALSHRGRKPAILAEVTRIWQTAARAGRVRVAALRCSDFYGPGVSVSHLGATGFQAVAQGKAATLLAPPDTPHDFAYIPDIARAVLVLLDAPDADFGQAWNLPCAPTRTPRELLALGAAALRRPLKVTAVPLWTLPALGVFVRFMKEVADVSFTFDRPYVVDGRKFATRFRFTPTPFEVGVPATVASFSAP